MKSQVSFEAVISGIGIKQGKKDFCTAPAQFLQAIADSSAASAVGATATTVISRTHCITAMVGTSAPRSSASSAISCTPPGVETIRQVASGSFVHL